MSPTRGSGWAAGRWRARVLAATGGACAVCGSRVGVQAHHVTPLAANGDPEGPGVALCREHHRQVTGAARSKN